MCNAGLDSVSEGAKGTLYLEHIVMYKNSAERRQDDAKEHTSHRSWLLTKVFSEKSGLSCVSWVPINLLDNEIANISELTPPRTLVTFNHYFLCFSRVFYFLVFYNIRLYITFLSNTPMSEVTTGTLCQSRNPFFRCLHKTTFVLPCPANHHTAA